MTISPIGAAAHQNVAQALAANKKETAEVAGAPDHDGDSDDSSGAAKGVALDTHA